MNAEKQGHQEGEDWQEPRAPIEDQIRVPAEIENVIAEIGYHEEAEPQPKELVLRDNLRSYCKVQMMRSYLRQMGKTTESLALEPKSSALYHDIMANGGESGLKVAKIMVLLDGQMRG